MASPILTDEECKSQIALLEKEYAQQQIDFSVPNDLGKVKDQGILITGGASGIGAAIATKFANAGAYVVVLDLNKALGQEFEKEKTSQGLHIKFIECDITNYSSQLAAFKEALGFSPSGKLSHVFANAGCIGGIFTYPGDEGYDTSSDPPEPGLPSVQVSLIGMYYTAYLATHFLGTDERNNPSTHDRSLTLTGSVYSYRGLPNNVDYALSKAGARNLFKSLRGQIKDWAGIRLNMLAPTFCLTPLLQGLPMPGGIRFAPIENVVDAAAKIVTDERIHSRSILITADGLEDLRDDIGGHDGSIVMKNFLLGNNVPLGGS